MRPVSGHVTEGGVAPSTGAATIVCAPTDEATTRTPRDGDKLAPCVLAGPTCDSVDILYQRAGYELPLDLRAGDVVRIHDTGAYTATYSSVGFNGFAPLRVTSDRRSPGR